MPRYFFNSVDGTVERDCNGVELLDLNAARIEAVRYAGRVLHESPSILWEGHDFRVEVTDTRGIALVSIIVLAVDAVAAQGSSTQWT